MTNIQMKYRRYEIQLPISIIMCLLKRCSTFLLNLGWLWLSRAFNCHHPGYNFSNVNCSNTIFYSDDIQFSRYFQLRLFNHWVCNPNTSFLLTISGRTWFFVLLTSLWNMTMCSTVGRNIPHFVSQICYSLPANIWLIPIKLLSLLHTTCYQKHCILLRVRGFSPISQALSYYISIALNY